MVNFRIKILLSLFMMVGCFSSVLHGMGDAKKLVLSYVKNAKNKVVVPINNQNMIRLCKKEEDQSNITTILKKIDPYWQCPIISTRYLKESTVTLLYVKHQKNMMQNVVMTHYNNDDNAFGVHMSGLRDYIKHLNSEVTFDQAQFIIIFPASGPSLMFTALDQLRCRRQSNELQALVKGTLAYKNIKMIEKPYCIPFTGLSPIGVGALLSADDRFPSFWSIDTVCCPVGNTGLITETKVFANDTKE